MEYAFTSWSLTPWEVNLWVAKTLVCYPHLQPHQTTGHISLYSYKLRLGVLSNYHLWPRRRSLKLSSTTSSFRKSRWRAWESEGEPESIILWMNALDSRYGEHGSHLEQVAEEPGRLLFNTDCCLLLQSFWFDRSVAGPRVYIFSCCHLCGDRTLRATALKGRDLSQPTLSKAWIC